MKINNEFDGDHAVQNRFTAYLQTAVKHCKSRYLIKKYNMIKQEYLYGDDTELIDSIEDHSIVNPYQIENDELIQALSVLTPREQQIVLRRAILEESFLDIADYVGMKYVTVKAIYYRALKKLRKELEK
jgi:RNA polymerase sigma factor, sigma-70 family